ncbi:MAG: DNA-binding protein WhiA [Syntrophomonadaceae bacterium]
MSFSTQTKDELARLFPEKKCCQKAELAALCRMDGTLTISSRHKLGLQVVTENAACARKIIRLAKNVFQLEAELQIQKSMRLKKSNNYVVRFPSSEKMREVMKELGILDNQGQIQPGIKKELIRNQCCRRSYLRGVFLGAGSVNSPEGNYHLEIIANDGIFAEEIVTLMNRFPGIQAKISNRKNWYIVYLKESEQIVNFLNVMGAHQALLNFENTRIVKGMRNQVNRLVNCETANLNKTVNASLRQLENIRFLQDTIGLEKLPPRLQMIAGLRLENPDVSLKELGEMMDPPIGKSGVNHRMRKLEELADDLRMRMQK